MYAEQIISKIDGPLFKEQRRAILQLLEWKVSNKPMLTDEQVIALEGLINLLDEIADCAHDVYGKDCLLVEENIKLQAEEYAYEQRTQYYGH